MDADSNRLLLELQRTIRSVNREILNPAVTALTVDGMGPFLRLVAEARARYLCGLLELAGTGDADRPSEQALATVAQLRREYEELTAGAAAIEKAIQRGYLDVVQAPR